MPAPAREDWAQEPTPKSLEFLPASAVSQIDYWGLRQLVLALVPIRAPIQPRKRLPHLPNVPGSQDQCWCFHMASKQENAGTALQGLHRLSFHFLMDAQPVPLPARSASGSRITAQRSIVCICIRTSLCSQTDAGPHCSCLCLSSGAARCWGGPVEMSKASEE